MIIGTYDDGRVHVDIGRVPNECKVYIDGIDFTEKVHAVTITIRVGQITRALIEFAPVISSKVKEAESKDESKDRV